MRVLQLISSNGFYGAERVAAELVNGFSGTVHEMHLGVMAPVRGVSEAFERETAGTRAGRLYLDVAGGFSLEALRRLGEYLVAHRIEIVHSHGYKSNFYALAARLLYRRELKVLATVHSWILSSAKERLYKLADLIVLGFFQRIVVVSQPLLTELAGRRGLSRRLSYIANGVDTGFFVSRADREAARGRLGIPFDRLVIGCVASLTPEKAHEDLLAAFGALARRRPDALLVLVGDGPLRERVEALAAQWGLSGQVLFAGRRQDARSLYCAFDIFALVSHTEGLPMALLEAMAAALPVVVTAVGEMPRVIKGGENGIVAGPGEVDAIAGALAELAAHPDKGAALGKNARETVVERYSNTRMVRDYENLYLEMLARQG